MDNRNPRDAVLGASASVAGDNLSTSDAAVQNLMARINHSDDKVRAAAWQTAGSYGASAVKSLAEVMMDPQLEVARAGKRALWKIVRHVGRPGALKEKRAVIVQLLTLLHNQPTIVRREVLWMLSEIGSDETVLPVAAALFERELREDARVALERIPGNRSLSALKEALRTVSEDFRPAIAQSLRVRGVHVTEHPNHKVVPTRPQVVVKTIREQGI